MSVLLILFILALAAFSDAEPPNGLKETRSHGRRLIVEDLERDLYHERELTAMIPCIKSFLTKYVKVPLATLIMVLDEDYVLRVFARSLLSSMDLKFAFFQPSERRLTALDRSFDAIILMPNASSVTNDFKIPEPCTRDCAFICILGTIFKDQETFLNQVDTMVQSMWTQRVAKVVVLARVGDSVLAAGSQTFRTQELCVPSAAVVLDECENSSWNKLQELREPALNGCVLKVAYFDQSPYVVVKNESEELCGYEGRLIEEILRDNQIVREKVEWSDNTSYAEQADILLYKDSMADVVVGGLLQQAGDKVDYSVSYDLLRVVWLIPRVPNISLKGLISPFGWPVWLSIGGCLLLGGIIKTFLSRDLSWLDIFGLIIGNALWRPPTKLSSRILFYSWNLFGLFLTQLYVDSLADQLINASNVKIETIEDLLLSSFKIGGTAAHASFFYIHDDADEITTQIREKFVTFDKAEYTKLYEDVLSGENSTFALITVMNSSRSNAIETPFAYSMIGDPICSFPLVFATWRGFPYLKMIDETLERLNDGGIVDFLINMAILEDINDKSIVGEDEEHETALHFPHLIPALLLLLAGFFAGFMLLVLEIILYPSKYLE